MVASMKKPDIKVSETNSMLAGSEGQSTWMQGRNCVYRAIDETHQYRVSIRTHAGWKTYGSFNDIETATYVANVAILVEDCEEQYQLNAVGQKDKQELLMWRNTGQNSTKEKLAREKYSQVQKALEAMRVEEERLRKKLALRIRQQTEESRERSKLKQDQIRLEQEQRQIKEAAIIAEAPTAILLNLLQRDISGDQSRKIHTELGRRKLGK